MRYRRTPSMVPANDRTADTVDLSDAERRVLGRFSEELVARLGDDLLAVWLYGFRARGEVG